MEVIGLESPVANNIDNNDNISAIIEIGEIDILGFQITVMLLIFSGAITMYPLNLLYV